MSQVYLTCYRCGERDFKSKKELGGHMTSCPFTGTLYDQFNEAEAHHKRKHEQIEKTNPLINNSKDMKSIPNQCLTITGQKCQ